jgi:Flp pilus assembly protein TadD
MPYTLNGIGTHYYGRSNISVLEDTCEHCGRRVRLSSYDTREFFCVVFIPLIPLKQFRILSDCPVCRRHYRFPLKEFRQSLETKLAPLRAEVERTPRDPEAHLRLAGELVGYQMRAEAEAALHAGLAVAPNHGPLNRMAAHLAADRGDLQNAEPLFQKAAQADPHDAGARYAHGYNLARLGRHEEAVSELEAAWRLAQDDTSILYHLAESHTALQRWSEALHAWQRFVDRRPEMANDREILRRIKQCKEALHYPLSEAERKAGRRWWPFGGARRTAAATGATDWRQIGAALLVLAVLTVGIGGGTALWKQAHNQVWFDNGLPQPVQVTVDGETFDLAAGQHVLRSLAPGPHAVVVRGAGGEIERYDAKIPEPELLAALFDPIFYVYNVAEAQVYRRATVGYAAREADQSYREEILGLQRFFPQANVDFAFKELPDEIETSKKEGVETRIAFNPAADVGLLGLAFLRLQEGKVDEAERALRKGISIDPCAPGTRSTLVTLLTYAGKAELAAREGRSWVASCPGDGVEAHRGYQEAARAAGQKDELLQEYGARLAARPGDGESHYLYGRLLDDPAAALPYFETAVRLAPKLFRAHTAQGQALLALERDAEAYAALGRALDLPGPTSEIAPMFAMAAAASGAAEDAWKRLTPQGTEPPDQGFQIARWLAATAAGRRAEADTVLAEWSAAAPESAQVWAVQVQGLRLRGAEDEVEKELSLARSRRGVEAELALFHFERALEGKHFREAADVVDTEMAKLEGGAPLLNRIYGAAALLLSGDRPEAEARLAKLAEDLKAAPRNRQTETLPALVEGLAGRLPADKVLQEARKGDFQMLPHAYFILGVRAAAAGDAAGARAFFQKSRQRSLDLNLPYFASAALAESAEAR